MFIRYLYDNFFFLLFVGVVTIIALIFFREYDYIKPIVDYLESIWNWFFIPIKDLLVIIVSWFSWLIAYTSE
jgi:hypothetical protein